LNQISPLELRPASLVMDPRRAGTAGPDALSFARSAMRELVRGRWKIEKRRFDLDAEGRGEILYRLVGGGWTFHFFLVSLKLAEEQKLDRNWAQSWDAMGVLCQGEWTPEREARLRIEVPRQRSGYADYDTLIYARGNRSARLFEHVVERLAAGQQPDAALLARVGYILRTTAFIANGQLGTRSYAGLEPDHPFRRPYHAQMCSAFLLREYVYDLVDHMARARNPGAARLDPAWRRYLGLGNAAATGLVNFIVNHPHLMHCWCLAHERALAEAKARPVVPGFAPLLERAIRYFHEGEGGGDLFATAAAVARDLEKARKVFAEFPSWRALTDWAASHLGFEAQEVLHSLILELYPDIAEASADQFHIEERFEVRPEMTLAGLHALLERDYAWIDDADFADPTHSYFWYRSAQAPRDVRRGLRGLAREFEAETGMDTVLRVRELRACMARADGKATVAALLAGRPDLRHIVARVQSLAGLDYAELRTNWLSKAFSPFEPIRWVLAFYGMEKFEAAPPKSVRGSFLQGAPIAEDVEEGRDGVWPYPLQPIAPCGDRLAPLPPAGLGALRSVVESKNPDKNIPIAPRDLARTLQAVFQAQGAALGVAEEAANMVLFAQACGKPALAAVLRGESAGLFGAPAALDAACAQALGDEAGMGTAVIPDAAAPTLFVELVLRCAARGLTGLLEWRDGVALAGPGPTGAWLVFGSLGTLAPERGVVLVCAKPIAGLYDALAQLRGQGLTVWSGEVLAARRAHWERGGVTVARAELDALNAAAAALLVPVAEVPRLRPHEDTDPLKVF
jgi:hypothetical protein